MAGAWCPTEDMELLHSPPEASGELISEDDRSVAGDSWSVKSDCGSTLDDEQRHMDGPDALFTSNFRSISDYSSDKDSQGVEAEASILDLQTYWDDIYNKQLANFHEHGRLGEVWSGSKVTENVVDWTKNLCINISQCYAQNLAENSKSETGGGELGKCLSSWNVLHIGTGNGLLLHELAKQRFSDLTGIDYSEAAIDLAKNLAIRDGFININFLVDDVLETKLERKYKLVMDKVTLDAIELHSDGPLKRTMYWESLLKLVAPGGILVITSRYSTKDELVQEIENLNLSRTVPNLEDSEHRVDRRAEEELLPFRYLDHIHTHSASASGRSQGSHVETIAFYRT